MVNRVAANIKRAEISNESINATTYDALVNSIDLENKYIQSKTRLVTETSLLLAEAAAAAAAANTSTLTNHTYSSPLEGDDTFHSLDEELRSMEKLQLLLSHLVFLCNLVLLSVASLVLIYGLIIFFFDLVETMYPFFLAFPICILLFCCGHSLLQLGILRTLFQLLFFLFLSWTVEAIGVGSGVPFGHYHYQSQYEPGLVSGVPLEVAFSWYMILYLSIALSVPILNAVVYRSTKSEMQVEDNPTLASGILTIFFHFPHLISWKKILHSLDVKRFLLFVVGVTAQSVVCAFIALGFFLVLDPIGSVQSGLWVWENNSQGFYFGVPFSAIMGYFFSSLFIIVMWFIFDTLLLTLLTRAGEKLQLLVDPLLLSLKKLVLLGHVLSLLFVWLLILSFLVCVPNPAALRMVSVFSVGVPMAISAIQLFNPILREKD